MAEFVTTYRIPADLPEAVSQELRTALENLPSKQRRLADESPHIAAASRLTFDESHVTLHYAIAGQDVYAIVGRGLPAVQDVLRWSRQLLEAFTASYSAGHRTRLMHGGLIGANVVIDFDGQLHVLDFGVAECFRATLETHGDCWQPQVAAGVAPELWNSPGRFGERSDIFAAGVLLYEAATGKHPFGAIRNDPEDCKLQILTEIPVPPHNRRRELNESWSRFVFRALEYEPSGRYESFQAMLEALPDAVAVDTPPNERTSAESPSQLQRARQSRPGEKQVDDEEARRYRQQQAELRAEREARKQQEAMQKHQREQRRRRRKAQVQRIRTALRRHAVTIVVVLVIIVAASAAGTIYFVRSRNSGRIANTLRAIAEQATGAFRDGNVGEVALALQMSPSQSLCDALAYMRKVAPLAQVSFAQPVYGDVTCTTASVTLNFGEVELPGTVSIDDKLKDRPVHLKLDDVDLSTRIQELVASQQIPEPVVQFIETLRSIFASPLPMSTAQSQLVDLLKPVVGTAAPEDVRVLGYLAKRPGLKTIQFGTFGPVPGDDAIRALVILTDSAGRDIPPEGVFVHFWYDLGPEQDHCELTRVTLSPAEEPAAHKLWCMQQTMGELQQAFHSSDAKKLAQLIPSDREADITRTLSWVTECKSSRLKFEDVQVSAGLVQASIEFTPGMLDDRQFETELLSFSFDPDNDWRIMQGPQNIWPDVPAALTAQQQGQALLAEFREAWISRKPDCYLELFEGHRNTPDEIQEMFDKIDRDKVTFEITADEVIRDKVLTLRIQLEPKIPNPDLAEEYEKVSFGFEVLDRRLQWDQKDSPVLEFEGLNYRRFVRRIDAAKWSELDTIAAEVENAGGNMKVDERERLTAWLNTLRSVRDVMVPESTVFAAGLPVKAHMQLAPGRSVPMRLIYMESEPPAVMYIMERELRIPEFDEIPAKPWELWAQLTGRPPDGQLVGIRFEEALSFAKRHHCLLPTCDQWVRAASQFGDTPDQQTESAFYGGVWEFCGRDSDESHMNIIGGCWLDYDAELAQAGVPAPTQRPDELQGNQQLFGTIGFRLVKPLDVPREILQSTAVSESLRRSTAAD